MKQDWEDLGSEYEGSSSVLIGDVDCTVHSGLCSKHGVQGYPTIKYYKDGDKNGESYNGGRSKDALTLIGCQTSSERAAGRRRHPRMCNTTVLRLPTASMPRRAPPPPPLLRSCGVLSTSSNCSREAV